MHYNVCKNKKVRIIILSAWSSLTCNPGKFRGGNMKVGSTSIVDHRPETFHIHSNTCESHIKVLNYAQINSQPSNCFCLHMVFHNIVDFLFVCLFVSSVVCVCCCWFLFCFLICFGCSYRCWFSIRLFIQLCVCLLVLLFVFVFGFWVFVWLFGFFFVLFCSLLCKACTRNH